MARQRLVRQARGTEGSSIKSARAGSKAHDHPRREQERARMRARVLKVNMFQTGQPSTTAAAYEKVWNGLAEYCLLRGD
ncbi:hypothetical protein SPRG_06949 [Saprolegnia parasitica CBS 223.65]|uniref:Uncharacterized protein n=1 Tax=Saprolegnia parasitica (strain CBS 223.65) TaxID=695850 RepID=A0A067CA44_SAPPC|nr:hypothetical protein SPRG_06949 [Saprolegnia parasitica CBS 223.65]KDO27363.1 hypothetical protein SPRG_06949 [Saprolegnia parasitica CBS 223.65]|eukprot:XP_012201804.1 hypothetical protein SPRG_06949 [Saprolegnia parasitica CBS 223.65]